MIVSILRKILTLAENGEFAIILEKGQVCHLGPTQGDVGTCLSSTMDALARNGTQNPQVGCFVWHHSLQECESNVVSFRLGKINFIAGFKVTL